MRHSMTGMDRLLLAALAFLCALAPAAIRAEQAGSAPGPNATACAYLPVADLEAHYGAKAQNVRGFDRPASNTCNANFPDAWHTAIVESHPPADTDLAMTAGQRLEKLMQGAKDMESKDFGAIGCFRTSVDIGKKLTVVACFLGKAPYLALTMQSIDANHVSFDAVKGLLEKAAARRK